MVSSLTPHATQTVRDRDSDAHTTPCPTWPIDSAATVCPPSPLPVYVKPTPVLVAQIENDYEKINCNFLNCFFLILTICRRFIA